jgi:curli biogenesis system outer membrane secretion channel CsgG
MKATNISRLLLALFVFSICAVSQAPPAQAGAKRRVAVMPFSYGAVSAEVGTTDVGKGITSLVITKLVNDGTYSVVDREMLDSILKEQNLSVSDRANPTTACKIGKILSVDAIIVGTVTEFGFETKTSKVGGLAGLGGSYVPYAGGFASMGLGSVGVRKSKAHVAIDARLIDINTTEILGACHGEGFSKRGGVTLLGGIGPDFESSGFGTTIAGEATLQAVDSMGQQLIAMAAKIPDNQSIASANVVGKVADVSGTQVIVNIGKSNGIANGDNLVVNRIYKTVKDPNTGNVLKELSKPIAVVSVSEVDASSSTGTITKGTGVQVGDAVRKVTMEVSAILLEPVPSTATATTTTQTKAISSTKKSIK